MAAPVCQLEEMSKHSTIPGPSADGNHNFFGSAAINNTIDMKNSKNFIQVHESNQSNATPLLEIKRINCDKLNKQLQVNLPPPSLQPNHEDANLAAAYQVNTSTIYNNTVIMDDNAQHSLGTSPYKGDLQQPSSVLSNTDLCIKDSRILLNASNVSETQKTQLRDSDGPVGARKGLFEEGRE